MIKPFKKRWWHTGKHKHLSYMFLINTQRLFIPLSRLPEIEALGGINLLDKNIKEFVRKYFVKDPKRYKESDKSEMGRIRRIIYKRLMLDYHKLLTQSLLIGDSVALPGGMGTMEIIDFSPISERYQIDYRGQDPGLVISVNNPVLRKRMKQKGWDSLRVYMKQNLRVEIFKAINEKGVKYRKAYKKQENGKHEIYQPSSNTYITGKALQGEAV